MSTDIWDVMREKLEQQLVKAALDLAEYTGAYSFSVSIKNTSPSMMVSLSVKDESNG